MPSNLSLADHLAGLREALHAFGRYADRAGLDAPVPSCPEWTVRELVAHQGMVHRWATGLVTGEEPSEDEAEDFERAGLDSADPLGWLADGGAELLRALESAPEDLHTVVFLNDAPRPREFWARRQCHETTVHAVDALSAALGRLPRAEDVWVTPTLAGDGIDELLGGFLTRPRSRLRCEDDALLVVAPDDLDDWWEVSLGPRPAATTRRTPAEGAAQDAEADWELTGPAVELYLRLWNRSDPLDAGDDRWQRLTAVRWA